MPVYDFECPSGHVFEEIVRLSEPIPDECPECKALGKDCKRVWTTNNLNITGSVIPTGKEEVLTDLARGARAIRRRGDRDDNFAANIQPNFIGRY